MIVVIWCMIMIVITILWCMSRCGWGSGCTPDGPLRAPWAPCRRWTPRISPPTSTWPNQIKLTHISPTYLPPTLPYYYPINHQVDATYLSPHVNMAARLETSSRQYGVPVLMSEKFYELMSDEGKEVIKIIQHNTTQHTITQHHLTLTNFQATPTLTHDPPTHPHTLIDSLTD